MRSPKVAIFSTASFHLNRCPTMCTGLSGRNFQASTKVTMPRGMFMANSHGHEATDNIAADKEGPATEAKAITVALSPKPRPRSLLGYIILTNDGFMLIIIAEPKPWIMREMTSDDSDSDNAQSSEPTVNIAVPQTYSRLYPFCSPMDAKGSNVMTTINWNEFMTHIDCEEVMPSWSAIVGSATLQMVLSIIDKNNPQNIANAA